MQQAIHSDVTATPDFAAIKCKQQGVWSAGNYGRIGTTLQITGEQLCEAMDLRAGTTVLDVAGGNGNVSLAAARRFADVTCTDYVQSLLDQAEKRAGAEGLAMTFQRADAEDLPFSAERFDNVVSTFGVMFAPNQAQASSELLRVCKRGGRIGMANWTPDGFIGQLLKTVGTHVAPPAGVNPAAAWGTEAFLQRHFATASDIQLNKRWFVFRYESPQHWLDVFSTYYGPTLKAFEALGSAATEALKSDALALIDRFNRAQDGTMVVPSSYLEAVITR